MRKGVMEYNEQAAANAADYCPICSAPVDGGGLALECGGEDTTHLPRHCENCGQPQHSENRTKAEQALNFLARFHHDDPHACQCVLHMLHRPTDSCRKIAAHLGISKTTINEALKRAESTIPEIAAILGRRTAGAIAQQTRRAAETTEPEIQQMSMFE